MQSPLIPRNKIMRKPLEKNNSKNQKNSVMEMMLVSTGQAGGSRLWLHVERFRQYSIDGSHN